MSKIDGQITGLRKAAQVYRNLGRYAIEVVLLDAADTITELRGALQVASVDCRHLAAENAKLRQQLEDVTVSMGRVEERCAKLRELLADTLMQPRDYCKKYGIEYESWDSANAHLDARMRELGVEP